MIELKGITKQYAGKKNAVVNALNGIDLSFGDRGFQFILGKSGCGKTTLLNILAGIDRCSSGSISFEGRAFSEYKAEDLERYRNSIVGTIFQEYYLIPYYSVGENVKLALDLQNDGKTEEEKVATVNEYLKKVDLVDENGETLYHRSISGLSGGQKQRVAIARAIIKHPKILLADEPTGALDSRTGKEIFRLLKDISADCLVIAVTHDEEFATTYGDRVIRMENGVIVEDSQRKQPDFSDAKDTKMDRASSGKLSLRHCLKMGAVVLFHKRIRLAISMLCSILALVSLGLCVLNLSLSANSAYLRKAYAEKDPCVILNCYDEYVSERGTSKEQQYDLNETKKDLWTQYGLTPIYPDKINYWGTFPLDQEGMYLVIENGGEYSNLWEIAFEFPRGFVQIDDTLGLKPDSRFHDQSLCRYPAKTNEIAISDIKADVYLRFGLIDSDGAFHRISAPDDLIGLRIKSRLDEDMTICGVFSTPESELIRSHPNRDDSYESTCVRGCMDSSLVNYWYVCPGFYEAMEGSAPNKFLMPLNKGYYSDNAFLKQMAFDEEEDGGGHHYYVEVASIYGDRVSTWESAMSEFRPYLIGLSVLFIVFSILLMMNYLVGSINGRKKEFGILLSLGAGKKSIGNIFFAECVIIETIVFIVSYVALWIISLITNWLVFRVTYFFVGLLTLLIILACSILAMGIASMLSIGSINALTPKNIIVSSEE